MMIRNSVLFFICVIGCAKKEEKEEWWVLKLVHYAAYLFLFCVFGVRVLGRLRSKAC